MLKVWGREAADRLPWMVVRFPRSYGIDTALMSCPFDARAVSVMLDSPVRRELAERILSGDAAVWLMMESGNKDEDDAAARLLDSTLKRLNSSMVIKDSVEEFSRRMGIEYRLHPSQGRYADMDVRFSMMRLSPSDREEGFLVANLRKMASNPASADSDEPAIFAVFARGLVWPPLVGDSIDAGSIEYVCRTLLSPCSCEIDESELGRYCLMTVEWGKSVRDQIPLGEAVLPPALLGLEEPVAEGPAATGAQGEVPLSWSPVVRNTILVSAVGAVAVAVACAVLSWRVLRRRRGT